MKRDKRALDLAGIDLGGAKSLGIKLPEGMTTLPPPAKRNKYGAVPTVYGGFRYASKAEASRAKELDDLHHVGLRYIRQPRFNLGCPENVYVADFLVWGFAANGGDVHVEDVKGRETPKFARDKKLWRAYGPCQLWIIKSKGKNEYINGGLDFQAMAYGTQGKSTEDDS